MLKLNYQGTFEFTSEDIGDYNADPALVFTAYSLRSTEWVECSRVILEDVDTYTVDEACKMLLAGLVSVKQGEEVYPLKTLDDVKELHQATGDTFIKHVALGVIISLSTRDDERKKKSGEFAKASKAGKAIQ